MKKSTFLSIIIPVYQAERYLKQCLNTIQEQYIEEVEVILVEDGSNDDSLNICKKWRRKYDWITVLSHNNRGVSYTRNRGIEEAKGEYIWFIDADDTINDSCLEKIKLILLEEHPDILIFGYRSILNRKYLNEFDTMPEKNESIQNFKTQPDLFWKLYKANLIHNIGTKVYCRDLIVKNKVRFDENISIYEDALFCVCALKYANKLYIYDEAFYQYNLEMNHNSLSHGYKRKFAQATYLLFDKIAEVLSRKDTIYFQYFLDSVLKVLYNKVCNEKCAYTAYKKYVDSLIKEKRVKIALRNYDIENNSNDSIKIWKKIKEKKYMSAYFQLKLKMGKGEIVNSKLFNDIFDFCYSIYKSTITKRENLK